MPPLPGSGERGTRWRERGLESPNSDEGTYTVVLFMYTDLVFYSVLVIEMENILEEKLTSEEKKQ